MILSKFARSFLGTEALTKTSVTQTTFGSFDEPTFLIFDPIFNFNMPTGLFADERHVNSALAYLKRIGETSRYESLLDSIKQLQDILELSPWSFNTVTGFNDAMHRSFNEPAITDGQLSFEMIESLDMRVSLLIHKILEVVYDQYRKVEVLPRNLQEFSMGLLIHEFRIFKDNSGAVTALFNQSSTTEPTSVTAINHFLLHFGKCRFLQTSGKSMFDSKFDNSNIVQANTNIDIEYKIFTKTFNFNKLATESTSNNNSTLKSTLTGNGFSSGTTLLKNNGPLLNNPASTKSIVSDILASTKDRLASVKNRALNITTNAEQLTTTEAENIFDEYNDGTLANKRRAAANAVTVSVFDTFLKAVQRGDVNAAANSIFKL